MTKEELRRENEELRRQLGEVEDALRVLREGRVVARDMPTAATNGERPGRLGKGDDRELVPDSKSLLTLAVDAAQLGLWHWDIRTGDIVWSPQCKTIYGLPADAPITYELFLQQVHPDDRERIAAALTEAVATHGDYNVEKRIILPGGTVRWTASLGRCYYDETGQPVRLSGVTMDITGRKQAEEALKEGYDELERRVEERTAQLSEAAKLARTERQRLYDVLEALPVYVCLLDPHHNMPFANRLFREWFGYQPTRKCYEFLFSCSEPCEPCGTYEVLRTNKPHRWEWTGPNGRQYDIFDFPFLDTDGSPLILEMGIDITERKQAEQELKGLNETLEQRISQRTEELRQSREDLARAQAVGQIGWWRLDTLNNVLTWSTENYRIFGVPEGTSLTYEAFLSIVHADDRQYVDSSWLAGLRGAPYDIEHRIVTDSGVKWVREKAYLEFDDEGGLLGGFGITQDITPRKEAEQALRESEERERERAQELQAVLDAVPAAVWIAHDPQALRIVGNRLSYDWVRLPEGENPSQSLPEGERATTFRMVKDGIEIPPEEMPVQLSAAGAEIRNYEFDFVYPDGSVRSVLGNASPLVDEHGQPRGSVSAFVDITERKQAEEEVRIARDALEVKVADRTADLARMVETLREEIHERHRAEEALHEETDAKLRAMEELRKKDQLLLQQSRLAAMGEMINNIAHQWRQPLNLLGLNVQKLLLYYDLGDFDRNLLASSIDDAMSLVNHMSQTIDDFRTFFRTDREKIRFDICHAVEKTISLVRNGLTVEDIQLKVSVAEGITITGYENEFCQVLMNILLNARDALIERRVSPGEIIMTVEPCEGVCLITIGDNAGGIPEEILDRIFEPYFSTKGLQGTGIGLYMSKQIIETNMGGRLSVRNTPCGAEFRIEI